MNEGISIAAKVHKLSQLWTIGIAKQLQSTLHREADHTKNDSVLKGNIAIGRYVSNSFNRIDTIKSKVLPCETQSPSLKKMKH